MSKQYNETEMTMRLLADATNAILNGIDNKGNNGFVIMVFQAGQSQGGAVNFISNGHRGEVITMLKEFVARQEGRYISEGGNA